MKKKEKIAENSAFSVSLCCIELREVVVEATEEKSSPAVRRLCQTKASLAERFISLSLISPSFQNMSIRNSNMQNTFIIQGMANK